MTELSTKQNIRLLQHFSKSPRKSMRRYHLPTHNGPRHLYEVSTRRCRNDAHMLRTAETAIRTDGEGLMAEVIEIRFLN